MYLYDNVIFKHNENGNKYYKVSCLNLYSLFISSEYIFYFHYVYFLCFCTICSYIFLLFQASDWDKYAAEEYEMLVAEEGGNDAPEEM